MYWPIAVRMTRGWCSSKATQAIEIKKPFELPLGKNGFEVGLGHRRLSIIDLSAAAHQPMCNENGTIWIVFNGEIYNFQEIREGIA